MEGKSKDRSAQALGGASVSGSTIDTGPSHENTSRGELFILYDSVYLSFRWPYNII